MGKGPISDGPMSRRRRSVCTGLLALCLLAGAAPVAAGALYRCVGADGVNNYSSTRIQGATCKTISSYGSQRVSTVAAPPARPVAAATEPVAARPATDKPPAAVAAPGPHKGAVRSVDFRTAAAGAKLDAPAPAAGAKVTRGAVYKFVKNGVTHYTNLRPRGASGARMLFSYIETCYACGLRPGVNFGTVALNTQAYSEEIAAAAREFGVEEALVRAIIHAESAFNPNALSHKGAQGLMQLMPGTAGRFGVANAFAAGENIRGGVQYLSWLLKRFGGNVTLVAAGYNAGEGAVDRHGGVPPYAETQRYVERVGVLADRYRGALGARASASTSAGASPM